MKKNLLALALTAGLLSLAMPSGLRAEDQKPTATESGDGGPCTGCCKEGGKKGDKDADKAEKPAPTPAPAQ